MTDVERSISIRPRPVIRYLGLMVGVVAGLPSVFGIGFFLLNPGEIAANPGGAAFAFAIGTLCVWASWRWMAIRRTVSKDQIVLSGWFRTTRVSTAEVTKIEKVERSIVRADGPVVYRWHYELRDREHNTLGEIPAMLHACRNWEPFLDMLYRIASSNAGGR